MSRFNKKEISRSFSASAPKYDQHAVMQRAMADEIIIESRKLKAESRKREILDLGCGTGYLTLKLAKRFSRATVVGIDLAPGMIRQAKSKVKSHNIKFTVADAETVRLKKSSFDFVVCNASLQWMDPAKILPRVATWLKPGGLFLFKTFGPQTLSEMRQAGFKVNDFSAAGEIKEIAEKYFTGIKVSARLVRQKYANVRELICYLKDLGAQTSNKRTSFQASAFKQYKQKYSIGNKIRATFEIISGKFVL